MDIRSQVFSFNPVQRRTVKILKPTSATESVELEFLIKTPTAAQRDQIVEALKATSDRSVKSPTRALATATVLCTYDPKDPDKRVFDDADIELFMSQPDLGTVSILGSEVFDLMNDSENHAKKL